MGRAAHEIAQAIGGGVRREARGVDAAGVARPRKILLVNSSADHSGRPVPIDRHDVRRFKLVVARERVRYGIVRVAPAVVASDALDLLEVVIAEAVDQRAPVTAFPGVVRGVDERERILAPGRVPVDEHVELAALPALVLVERPPSLLESVLQGVLAGALHECPDVLAVPDARSRDSLVCAVVLGE